MRERKEKGLEGREREGGEGKREERRKKKQNGYRKLDEQKFVSTSQSSGARPGREHACRDCTREWHIKCCCVEIPADLFLTR